MAEKGARELEQHRLEAMQRVEEHEALRKREGRVALGKLETKLLAERVRLEAEKLKE